jgi:hypothetical protein
MYNFLLENTRMLFREPVAAYCENHELNLVYLTADGQSTSSSWYWALLWGRGPDFILILFLVTIALLFFL